MSVGFFSFSRFTCEVNLRETQFSHANATTTGNYTDSAEALFGNQEKSYCSIICCDVSLFSQGEFGSVVPVKNRQDRNGPFEVSVDFLIDCVHRLTFGQHELARVGRSLVARDGRKVDQRQSILLSRGGNQARNRSFSRKIPAALPGLVQPRPDCGSSN